MNTIRVAVIDSGIKPSLINESIDNLITFRCSNNDITISHGEALDLYGHGTAVASIIMKSKTPVSLNILKIFDQYLTEPCLLIHALKYIRDHLDVHIVHMSLGLTVYEDLDELRSVCLELYKKGILLISSFDNGGAFSYPAAFDCVLGVRTGYLCKSTSDFEYVEDSIINICAKGDLQRVAWTVPSTVFIGGNSFAAAHTTVRAIEYMAKGHCTLNEIINCFKYDSLKIHTPSPMIEQEPIFHINKAAIFPFNKEMHSLVRFQDMLPFQINKIYDIRYSGLIGSTTNHILSDCSFPNQTIENIENIDWAAFDTIILGHMDKLISLTNGHFNLEEFVNLLTTENKKIYSFDKLPHLKQSSTIYWPEITHKHVPSERFGMLYRIGIPILGVFGTSSQQGKFTLQMYLRKYFQEEGYRIGQLGSEPSSLLYGMNYVFPMGYNDSVYLNSNEMIRYLNYCLHNMELEGNDLIIVGSQSGTVPFDTGNLEYFTTKQQTFLYGTLPDLVCLCVNPYDEIDYIEKTIKSIESVSNCKVNAIVVFPMTIKDDWLGVYGKKRPITENEYRILKRKLEDRFSLSVYKLGDTDSMYSLYQDIIDQF